MQFISRQLIVFRTGKPNSGTEVTRADQLKTMLQSVL